MKRLLLVAYFAFGFYALISFAQADVVVLIGNTEPSGLNADRLADRKIQENALCQAVEGAKALGHEVLMLAPSVTCNGKKYVGACPNEEACETEVVREKIRAFSKTLPVKPGQNLLIQTVGHGIPDQSYSWDTDAGPDKNSLALKGVPLRARELASILKESGILSKVNRVRGVWFQCYGGGWNELARLISPPGKFCSIAQSSHNRPAVLLRAEIDQQRSEFIDSFWKAQRSSKGRASMEESLFQGNRRNAHDAKVHRWQSSSRYQLEKATRTGFWSSDFDEDPTGVFESGYTALSLPSYQKFRKGASTLGEQSWELHTKDSDQVGQIAYSNRNNWFFQTDEAFPAPPTLSIASCKASLESPFSKSNDSFLKSVAAIETKLDEPIFARAKKQMLPTLENMKKRYAIAAQQVDDETKQYHAKSNELLKKSAEVMRKLKAENKTYEEIERYKKEYADLEAQLKSLDQLEHYPKIREMIALEGAIQHMNATLELLRDPKVKTADKEAALATWECENSPVFSGT